MKIAAYGVGKNEESNIVGWYEGIKDADYVLYLDTGSTDDTLNIAKSLGINVVHAAFSPWDETSAKNTALSLIPLEYDYCINLDLDQHMMTKDWKVKVLNFNNDKEVLVCNLVSSDGLADGNIIKQLYSIHKRTNCFWFGYRPQIKKYGYYPEEMTKTTLEIFVKDMPGTDERFDNRETLYVNSFLNYVGNVRRYRGNQVMLSALTSLALAYYEKDDKDNFNLIYKEIKNFIGHVESTINVEVPDQYLLSLAYTLFNPEDTSSIYQKLNNSKITEYQKIFLKLRTAAIYFKTNQYEKIQNIAKEIEIDKAFFEGDDYDWSGHHLSETELDFIKFIKTYNSSTWDLNMINYLCDIIFSNIGYGKRHGQLAQNSFNYFMENGYE